MAGTGILGRFTGPERFGAIEGKTPEHPHWGPCADRFLVGDVGKFICS